MLISHKHRFIYLKTIKTASTSTEVLFQALCMPPIQTPQDWEEWHATNEVITKYGIVGERMKSAGGSTFFNHMSAKQVITTVGLDLWSSYFKFANVRNPWDKVVSHFFYYRSWADIDQHLSLNSTFEAFVASYKRWPVEELLCKQEYEMAGYIRYEHLQSDIADTVARLSVCIPQYDIPRLKTGLRPGPFENYRRLYGSQERFRIEGLYHDWVERFGYKF